MSKRVLLPRVLLPRVVQAHRTLVAQLAHRGYNVADYANASIQEISAMLETKQLIMVFAKPDDSKVRVVFHVTKSVRPPTVQDYVEDAFHNSGVLSPTDELIIVAKDGANDTLVSVINKLWSDDKHFVSVRSLDSLQFDVLKHDLVPHHRVLSDTDKAVVMSKHGMTLESQFPEIGRHDPVAVALGTRPAQLLEIERPSRTAVTGLYYRICV